MRQRVMTGRFCEKTDKPKRAFDPRSFRWTQRGRVWILIGCPKGSWMPRTARCKVGTRAHKIMVPSRKPRCPVGQKHVSK